jgi:hypothetical protein
MDEGAEPTGRHRLLGSTAGGGRSLPSRFGPAGSAVATLQEDTGEDFTSPEHGEWLLDEAIEESFPASDPASPAHVAPLRPDDGDRGLDTPHHKEKR